MLGMAAIRDRHTGRVEGAVARAAIDAGHSPYISQAQYVATVILETSSVR